MGARFEVHNGDQECDARDRAQHASSPAQHVGGGRIRARAAGSVLSTGLKLLSPAQCLHVSFLESFRKPWNNAGETHQPGFLGASLGGSDQNARFDRLKVLPRCRLHAPARTYARKH